MTIRTIAGAALFGLLAGGLGWAILDGVSESESANFGTNPNQGANPNLGSNTPPAKVKFEPKYINVVYLRFDANGAFKSDHAFFLSSGEEASEGTSKRDADLAAAKLQIAYFKLYGKWEDPLILKDLTDHAYETYRNFEHYMFFDQSRIFMHVENPSNAQEPTWTFHKDWPILFTKFGANNRVKPLMKNYAFFNAQTLDGGTETVVDDFLYVENYFTHDHGLFSRNRKLKPRKLSRKGRNYNYSFNIHLIQKEVGRPDIPIIIDPDTGNGSDD